MIMTRKNMANKGFFNQTGEVSFVDSNDMRAHITDQPAENSIKVVAIDDYFKDKKVTYIKMDIEGSEREALNGAADILIKQKPKLAICLYHKSDDLWEIPLLINKIQPGYHIYIRQHA